MQCAATVQPGSWVPDTCPGGAQPRLKRKSPRVSPCFCVSPGRSRPCAPHGRLATCCGPSTAWASPRAHDGRRRGPGETRSPRAADCHLPHLLSWKCEVTAVVADGRWPGRGGRKGTEASCPRPPVPMSSHWLKPCPVSSTRGHLSGRYGTSALFLTPTCECMMFSR